MRLKRKLGVSTQSLETVEAVGTEVIRAYQPDGTPVTVEFNSDALPEGSTKLLMTTGERSLLADVAGASETTIAPGDDAVPRPWISKLREIDVTPFDYGAAGDETTDDTTAVQNCIDAAGDDGLNVKLTAKFSVSSVALNYGSMLIGGLGIDTGFIARTAESTVKSLLADRIVAGSLEATVLRNFSIDGNDISTCCLELERFTRGCGVVGVLVFDSAGKGAEIKNSWSYLYHFNRHKNCAGIGLHQSEQNNAMQMLGNHFTESVIGWQIDNAQAASIVGNTSEYNKGTNFAVAGRSLEVEGNYFEAFHSSITGSAGQEYSVILGNDSVPFINSTFNNYVNGGSVSANSFFGDGVHVKYVIGSRLKASFAESCRHQFAHAETDTIIGNHFDLSFDDATYDEDLVPATITNITSGSTGGTEVMQGTNVFGNHATRAGTSNGFRDEVQIEPNGTTGSVAEWRVNYGAANVWRIGKLGSSSDAWQINRSGTDLLYLAASEARLSGAYADTIASTPNVFVGSNGKLSRSTVAPLRWQSSGEVSVTATTDEEVLATITIPAGAMGANGQIVWSYVSQCNNTADDKIIRVRLGGLSGTVFGQRTQTTSITDSVQGTIGNNNSASAQIGLIANGTGLGAGGSAPVTGTIDTSASTTLVITGQKETAGDNLKLSRFLVQLFPAA